MEFKHPKYYKELRKRNTEAVAKSGISSHASLESDQVISANKRDGGMKVRAPGPGLKLRAATHDLAEASGDKPQAPEASSRKRSLE
tara:strand:+ start:26 stop:283 length:258 start_codon:yes stop_codon:yes gene_type:complete